MKRTLILFSVFFMSFMLVQNHDAYSQLKSLRQMRKERKQQRKSIEKRAIKKARKEAKRLTKEEGWKVFPGNPPMDKMLEKSWIMQDEQRVNDDMSESPAYLWSSGNGVAQTQSAAQMQAIELARIELASQLETQVAGLVNANMGNEQLTTVDAVTKQSIVRSSKSITSATLKNVKPGVLIYRTSLPRKALKKNNRTQLAKGTMEVQVVLFYDLYQADIQVRKEIVKELKDKMDKTEDELNKMMGLK